jgi:hypothetical protein
VSAPPVVTRHRFLSDFSTASGRPPAPEAVTPSTWRAYSRTRYDPGVHTAIMSSISPRRDVGTTADTSM